MRCPACGRQWARPEGLNCGMCEVFGGKRAFLVPLTREVHANVAEGAGGIDTVPLASLFPWIQGPKGRVRIR